MLRRDARLDVDVREQGPARPILAPHRFLPNRLADASESRRKPKFQNLSAPLFQQPARTSMTRRRSFPTREVEILTDIADICGHLSLLSGPKPGGLRTFADTPL